MEAYVETATTHMERTARIATLHFVFKSLLVDNTPSVRFTAEEMNKTHVDYVDELRRLAWEENDSHVMKTTFLASRKFNAMVGNKLFDVPTALASYTSKPVDLWCYNGCCLPAVDEAWDPEHVPIVAEALEQSLIHPQESPETARLWLDAFEQKCSFDEYCRRYKEHCTIMGNGKNGWILYEEEGEEELDDGDMKPAAK